MAETPPVAMMPLGQARGWGGARIGSGVKPNPVDTDEPIPPELEELALPPSDLTDDQQAFWRAYAPLALKKHTLDESTVPSFRLLCELHAKKAMVGAMVDKGALGGLRIYMQLAKQVENLMGRFCLAPFGKPMKADRPKKEANPWSTLTPPK